MGLDQNHTGCVGFLFDAPTADVDWASRPVGTFFLVSLPSGQGARRFVFVVTAQHVVQQYPQLRATMRASNNSIIDWTLPSGSWFFPDDAQLDLAICPLLSEFGPGLDPTAWPIEENSAGHRVQPRLGASLYFAGLLLPVGSTWGGSLVPVVRTGSVAALFQRDVSWGDDSSPSAWRSVAHLIDCRSWGGFSGSPCFMETSWPGPKSQLEAAIPEDHAWARNFNTLTGLDWSELLGTYYFQALFGVFVGFIAQTGIGVVLPVEYLVELLDSESVAEWRRRNATMEPE